MWVRFPLPAPLSEIFGAIRPGKLEFQRELPVTSGGRGEETPFRAQIIAPERNSPESLTYEPSRTSFMPRRQTTKPDFTEIRAIYAELSNRPLARQCLSRAQCCHFRLTGKTPQLTLGEALFTARGVRASGRKELKPHPEGACPLLGKDGRCTVYDHRPFGCRTHFCQAAGGMYPRHHVADLIQRLEALDESLGGNGPRPLERAVADCLDAF